MKRCISSALSFLMLVSIITVSITAFPRPVEAADYTVTVNFSTTSPKEIRLGITSLQNAVPRAPFNYNTENLIELLNSYNRVGAIRWNGTTVNVMNWRTGGASEEMLGQFEFSENYAPYTEGYRMMETRGQDTLARIRDCLQQTGTEIIMTCNVGELSPSDIGDLAKFCYDNHIPVRYFELGNEVDFMTTETLTPNWMSRWKTGTDYLTRMAEYNSAIKANYPGAKTSAVMSNADKAAFDNDYKTYPTAYWDSVTFHRYLGSSDDFNTHVANANTELANWDNVIAGYLADLNDPNTPITIGEHNVGLSGPVHNTQYAGIVISETKMRLSKHSNLKSFSSVTLSGGVAARADDDYYRDLFDDRYQRDLSVDPDTLNIQFYGTAPAKSAEVSDGAINNSTGVYTTTTTGGATVLKGDGTTMPALYSQAYRGADGKYYVLITNKSASTHDVTIKIDGVTSTEAKTRTYTTAAINARNWGNPTDPVTIQTASVSANSPVFIPAYSVTRVEWTRTASPETPPVPWLSHADARSGAVDLKWHRSVNATGYYVKYGTDPSNLTSSPIDVGNATSYSVTGLTNGQAYYFAVAAYNSSGTSLYSNQVLSNGAVYNQVSASLAAPGTPVIKRAYTELPGRTIVEWKSVPNATGYKVKYGTTSGSYPNVIDAGNKAGEIIRNLTNYTDYYFVVSAYNAFGDSANSSELSNHQYDNISLAPRDLRITNETTTSISMAWTPAHKTRTPAYFEAGASGWTVGAGSWSVVDHFDTGRATKVYKSSSTGKQVSAFTGGAACTNFYGEARVYSDNAFTTGSAGIISNYQDINNYYKFVYSGADNEFKLVECVNGTDYDRAVKTYANLGFSPDITDMEMKIQNENGKIDCYVNNNLVFTWTDSSPFSDGYFGLYTWARTSYFDAVRLWRDIDQRYNVYRSTSPRTGFTKVGSDITGTTWSQSGLVSGRKYYYYVKSERDGGESIGHSNTILKDK